MLAVAAWGIADAVEQAVGGTLTRARKGQKAADITFVVALATGRKLLVESKSTQGWDSNWVAKAKKDRATAGAEAVSIASRSLPRGIHHLTLIEALRQGLIAVERAKRAANMDEARVRELMAYPIGPQFREQVEILVTLSQGLIDNQTRERTLTSFPGKRRGPPRAKLFETGDTSESYVGAWKEMG